MGISDWSSDLCSSDLMPDCWYPAITQWRVQPKGASVRVRRTIHCVMAGYQHSGMSSGCGHSISIMSDTVRVPLKIGSACCRERVWQQVSIMVVDVLLKKNNTLNPRIHKSSQIT